MDFNFEGDSNGINAYGRGGAMVLVHDDRNMRIGFHCRRYQMAQERFPGILTRACGSLHDYRAIAFVRCLHDCLDLLQVIYIESREPIAIFCRMIQKLTQ